MHLFYFRNVVPYLFSVFAALTLPLQGRLRMFAFARVCAHACVCGRAHHCTRASIFSVAPWKYCHDLVIVVVRRNLWCLSAKVDLSPQCTSVWPQSSVLVSVLTVPNGAEFDMVL